MSSKQMITGIAVTLLVLMLFSVIASASRIRSYEMVSSAGKWRAFVLKTVPTTRTTDPEPHWRELPIPTFESSSDSTMVLTRNIDVLFRKLTTDSPETSFETTKTTTNYPNTGISTTVSDAPSTRPTNVTATETSFETTKTTTDYSTTGISTTVTNATSTRPTTVSATETSFETTKTTTDYFTTGISTTVTNATSTRPTTVSATETSFETTKTTTVYSTTGISTTVTDAPSTMPTTVSATDTPPSTTETSGSTTYFPLTESTSLAPEVEYLDVQLVLIPPRIMRATCNASDLFVGYCFCVTIKDEGTCSANDVPEIEVQIPAGIMIHVVVFAIVSGEWEYCRSFRPVTTAVPVTTSTLVTNSFPYSTNRTITTSIPFSTNTPYNNSTTITTSSLFSTSTELTTSTPAISVTQETTIMPPVSSNKKISRTQLTRRESLTPIQKNTDSKQETIYIPWQLLIGDTTSSSLMVEWMPGENVTEICWRRSLSSLSDGECASVAGKNHYVIKSLSASAEYEITLDVGTEKPLVLYASTRDVEKYRSMAWQCDLDNSCGEGSSCFPSTMGLLLPETDPTLVNLPSWYRYSCDITHLPAESSKLAEGRAERMAIGHADFTDVSDGDELPFCSLPNALGLINYWCTGKSECSIEYEQLHSYFIGTDGCQNTEISRFYLHIRNAYFWKWECPDGYHMYEPQLTCYYVYHNESYSFDYARRLCQSQGGDILFTNREEDFYEFLTKNLSISNSFWALGNLLDHTVTRPPMLYSATVDKAYVTPAFNGFDVDLCSDGCLDFSALTVCALSPFNTDSYSVLHAGLTPENCTSGTCQNGGTCFPVSYSPGLPGNGASYMCRCPGGYSGLRCEIMSDVREELLTPKNGVYEFHNNYHSLSIEFAYFGQNETEHFLGCYTSGALALLRLKCENQTKCSVSHRDLQNHLSSTCHPDIPSQLSVRHATHELGTVMACENEGELYAPTWTCFALTTDNFINAQDAKWACNSLGGDLAYPYENLQLCLTGDFSAWADGSHEPDSPNFDMVVANVSVLTCGNSSSASIKPALCEFPSVPLSSLPTTPSTTITTTTAVPTTITMPPTPKPVPDCPKVTPFPDIYPDYNWGPAKPGTSVSQKCPNGTDVTNADVKWFCGLLGQWIDLPDLSNCRTLDLGGWESELNDTSSGSTAGDTLDRVAANLTNNLSPGDIIGLVNLLKFAQERHKWDLLNASGSDEAVLNITEQYTTSVTNISSIILENPSVWSGIPQDTRFPTGSLLQENIEGAAMEVSLLLRNRTAIYSYTAISVMALQYSYHYFTESANRVYSHPKYNTSRVTLPDDFYSDIPDRQRVAVTFTAYNTLHCILSEGAACSQNSIEDEIIMDSLVNGPIMGMTVGNTSWSAQPNSEGVVATFNHFFLNNVYNLTNTRCVWWDPENSIWSSENCIMINTTTYETTCSCNHLTNLAVIMDINGKLSEKILIITQWITIIGCSVSLVCLSLAILTLATMVGKLSHSSQRTSIIHLNFCCCLFVAEIVLLAGLDATYNEIGCACVAGLLHYFLLATFCWMGVESFNVYMMLIKVFGYERSYMKFYYTIAYGMPLIIVGITLGITKTEGYGTKWYCWLDPENGLTWAFAAPALFVLLNNLVIFGLSVNVLRSTNFSDVQAARSVGRGRGKDDRPRSNEENKRNRKKMVKVSFTLAMTMGITWVLGFLMLFEGLEWMAIIFTTVNSLQGAGLFIVLILFPARPRAHFLKIMPCKPRKIGTQLYEVWYPYGKPGDYNELSSSEDTHSHYYQGSSFRWSWSTEQTGLAGGIPMIPRVNIDFSRRTSRGLDRGTSRNRDSYFNDSRNSSQGVY